MISGLAVNDKEHKRTLSIRFVVLVSIQLNRFHSNTDESKLSLNYRPGIGCGQVYILHMRFNLLFFLFMFWNSHCLIRASFHFYKSFYSHLVASNQSNVRRLATIRWNWSGWGAWQSRVSKQKRRTHRCRAFWIDTALWTTMGSECILGSQFCDAITTRRWI